MCIDRYTKFPLTKVVNNTTSNVAISFLNDYCHLHGFPRKIRVDHGSCFLSRDFKSFSKKYNIEIIYCTVGDDRSNRLVERLVYTVKSNLLAMSFDFPKPSLNSSNEKVIWNLRITKQTAIGCTPFEKNFNRMANTSWKNWISLDNHLDKGKSVLSERRARSWELHDGAEDGYLDADMGTQSDSKDNLPLALKTPWTPVPEVHNPGKGSRSTKNLVSGGTYYTRAAIRKNGEPYFNLVKEDII